MPDAAGPSAVGIPSVRIATAADAAALAQVDVASWRAAYRGIMPDAYLAALSEAARAADWQRRLSGVDTARGRLILASEERAGITGFVRLGAEPDVEQPGGYIFLLYVHPSHWGTGAGEVLMTAAGDRLRLQGFRSAALAVLEANHRARRFYERLGWRATALLAPQDYGGAVLDVLRYDRLL